jgi:Zn ribbon nucleic-acid-binding protein
MNEFSDEALVGDNASCPNCDEHRMDYLVWDEDGEAVTCSICGTEYVPGVDTYKCEDVAPDGTIAS